MAKNKSLRLLALDGNDTVGGTKYLVQTDGLGLMLDFGTNYKNHGKYYDQFLQPRDNQGILDYVRMGILPDAQGLYSEDLALPNLELTGPNVDTIDAVLITHAHMDHAGALRFLRPDIPAVMSPLTAATLKAMQDSGSDAMLYDNEHESKDARGLPFLKARDGKVGRDIRTTDPTSTEFEAFWKTSPLKPPKGKNPKENFHPGTLGTDTSDLKCQSFPVDHSVLGATAFVIDSPQGPLVYPGDIREHGSHGGDTRTFVEKVSALHPYVLFMEGTNIVERAEEVTTEEDVRRNVLERMSSMTGEFAIADFGPRNIERLQTFADAAEEHGRRLVVTPKDAYLLHAMHTADPSIPVPGDTIALLNVPKTGTSAWEDHVYEWYGDALLGTEAVRQSPGDFLVAFSLNDLKHLVDLRPTKGHYIYSSSEAFTEEMDLDFLRMKEWADRFGLRLHGLEFDKNDHAITPKGPEGLHASGHAPAAGLERIVRKLNPEIIVPLHTSHPAMFQEKFGGQCKVLVPVRGQWTVV